jgi:hypothetical protein
MELTDRHGTRRRVALIACSALTALPLASAIAEPPGASLAAADRARIELEIARIEKATGWAFVTVVDKDSQKYVQFATANPGFALLDLPVKMAYLPQHEAIHHDQCGPNVLTPEWSEVEKRAMSVAEEQRIKTVLSARKVQWADVYCLQMTPGGAREGYAHAIRAVVKDPMRATTLVERLLVDGYGLKSLDHLEIVTELTH